jgi:hypothetical protein
VVTCEKSWVLAAAAHAPGLLVPGRGLMDPSVLTTLRPRVPRPDLRLLSVLDVASRWTFENSFVTCAWAHLTPEFAEIHLLCLFVILIFVA